MPKQPQVETNILTQMRCEHGLSLAQIANQIGMSRVAVWKRLKAVGISLEYHEYRRKPTGKEKTRDAWLAMKDRCFDTTHPQFKDWGGRGITVYQRWGRKDRGHGAPSQRPNLMPCEDV